MAQTVLFHRLDGCSVQEQLRMILEAEGEARQRLEAAREECKRIVAHAEEEGRRRVRDAREARDTIIRAEEERLLAEARDKARQIEEGGRARMAAMRARAEARMERAVGAVLKCVLGQDDGYGQ